MVDRVQTTRYYTAKQRPPITDVSGELYVNFADIQIGALDTSHSPVDFVAVRYYSQTSTYVEGDYAIYNGYLYKCIEATPNPAGPFDSTRWSEILDAQEVNVLIQVEVNRALAAEANLQAELNAEIARAKAEEAHLQAEIDALNSSLSGIMPTGVSMDFYGVSPPTGWLLENGAVYNIADYPALGALLGNKFGGNGTTTFAVPNSGGTFSVGTGTGFALGATGGSSTTTLDTTHLPAHTHTIQSHVHTAQPHTHGFAANTIGMTSTPGTPGFAAGPNAPQAVTLSGAIQPATDIINGSGVLTTDSTGGSGGTSTPVSTLPPYIARTRIIKT